MRNIQASRLEQELYDPDITTKSRPTPKDKWQLSCTSLAELDKHAEITARLKIISVNTCYVLGDSVLHKQ